MSDDERQALIQRYAGEIMIEIHDTMSSDWRNSKGERMPADVGSFSGLHDYCDANMYLLDGIPYEPASCDCDAQTRLHDGFGSDHEDGCAVYVAWNAYMELCNEVSDEIDRRLRAEALALNTGERCKCGRLVRFNSSNDGSGHHVAHIDDLSHACEPCDFCEPMLGRIPKGSILPS